jgi:hypothetical protein
LWHHNGEYLAVPFANVLVKHGLHTKISFIYVYCSDFSASNNYVLAHTTDSRSNNLPMDKGVSSIFRWVDATNWDVQKNHHCCVCHVISLILGAVLKALNLPKTIVRPERANKYFPVLDTIIEVLVDEDVEVVENVLPKGDQEVNPDDARQRSVCNEPGWVEDDNVMEDIGETTGIALTLKKVCLISLDIDIHITNF